MKEYLERLNNLIDVEHVKNSEKLQIASQNYETIPRLPIIIGSQDDMSKLRFHFTDWPLYAYGDVFRDPKKMLLDELTNVYEGALIGDDKLYIIRANLGVGIIPSMFGCQVIQDGKDYPWVRPVDSIEEIKKMIARGIPDLKDGLGMKVIEFEQYFKETLNRYDKLKKTVHIGIADNQGPFNIATLIRGQDIFLDLYSNPEVIHEFLEVITQTYIEFSLAQKRIVEEKLDVGYGFQFRFKSGLKISEDHGLSISPNMYDEFCKRYNIKVAERFGGVTVLICGQVHHVLDNILSTPDVKDLIYWSEDIEGLVKAYKKCFPRKISIQWYGSIPEGYKDRFTTGLIIKRQVKNLDEAKAVLNECQTKR